MTRAAVVEGDVVVRVVIHHVAVTALAARVKDPRGQGAGALVGALLLRGIGRHVIVLGDVLETAAGLGTAERGGCGLLRSGKSGRVLLIGGLNGVAAVVLRGVGRTLEEDVLIVHDVEVVLVVGIVGGDLIVGVAQAVLITLVIGGDIDALGEELLEDGGRHVLAVDVLEVGGDGDAFLLGIGRELIHVLVDLCLHVVGKLKARILRRLVQHGHLDELVLRVLLEIGVPRHILVHAEHELGHAAQILLAQGLAGVDAHVAGVLVLSDGAVGIIIEVVDLGGAVLLAVDRHGGGAALQDIRVPEQQERRHQNKHDGDTAIEHVGAVLLVLLLRLADCLGIGDPLSRQILTDFLFS